MFINVIKNNIIIDLIKCLIKIFEIYITFFAIYCDFKTHFNNVNLRNFLQNKEITLIYALTRTYKFVKQIEKFNNILQKTFKKMIKLNEK